jgi:hypothetical protein
MLQRYLEHSAERAKMPLLLVVLTLLLVVFWKPAVVLGGGLKILPYHGYKIKKLVFLWYSA